MIGRSVRSMQRNDLPEFADDESCSKLGMMEIKCTSRNRVLGNLWNESHSRVNEATCVLTFLLVCTVNPLYIRILEVGDMLSI